MSELLMDVRIFENNPRIKDKRMKEHLKIKNAKLEDLKDIMVKYFGK